MNARKKMDKKKDINFRIEVLKGWAILGLGILALLVGLIADFTRVTQHNGGRLVIVPGILIMAWGAGILLKYSLAGADPETARKLRIDETDERTILVRSRAGYDAFQLSIPTVVIGFFAYTYLNRDTITIGTDYFWFYLIFMAAVPIIIYIIRLFKYDKLY
jgi:hypothetical protein